MADTMKWYHSQANYLIKTKPIDIKNDEDNLEIIVERIRTALKQHEELPYVTANQVGFDSSVYGIRTKDGIEVWANPIMARDGNKMLLVEDKEYGVENPYYIPRWLKINVVAYNCNKKLVCGREYEEEGACIMQHIMNNLDGISIADVGLEITQEFRDAPVEEREEVIKVYIENLEKLMNQLEEDLQSDSETSQMYEAYKFVKARAAGEIEAERQKPGPNRKTRRLIERIMKKFTKKK